MRGISVSGRRNVRGLRRPRAAAAGAAVVVAAVVALLAPAAANTYPYFDWAWGYPYEYEYHQNRWYGSSSVMQREQVYVKLNQCLPKNAKLKVRYRSSSNYIHREKASQFGACSVHQTLPSNGPSYVEFRIEFWNCTEDPWPGHGCGTPIAPQGDCYANVIPYQSCPGGYQWYRLAEAWAYTEVGGCSPACMRTTARSGA